MRRLYLAILNNKHHIAFVISLSLSFSLLYTSDSPNLIFVRQQANSFFAVLYSPVSWVKSLVNLRNQTELLREKNLQLSLQLESLMYLKYENEQLKKQLDYSHESYLQLLPAQVVNKGMKSNLTSITINVGSNSGVAANNSVLTPNGIVGKTVIVGENYSIVQLLSDLNFRISVRIMPSGATGILSWRDDDQCEIREVQKTEKIKIGDRVITSGYSDIFPRAIPVGEVVSVWETRGSFQKIITARIFNDLSSLSNVFVITDIRNETN